MFSATLFTMPFRLGYSLLRYERFGLYERLPPSRIFHYLGRGRLC